MPKKNQSPTNWEALPAEKNCLNCSYLLISCEKEPCKSCILPSDESNEYTEKSKINERKKSK